MIGWIQQLLSQAGNSIAGVANAATARILAVFNFVINYFNRVRGATSALYNAVRGWLAAHLAHALAVLSTLQWVVSTFVPKLLAALEAKTIGFVRALVAVAEALARQLVAAAEARLLQLLNNAGKAITALRDWAILQLAGAIARIGRLESRVFGVLGSAERIADYIVAAMANRLGRWALDNAARLGRTGWQWLLGNLTAAVGMAEDIIVRII